MHPIEIKSLDLLPDYDYERNHSIKNSDYSLGFYR